MSIKILVVDDEIDLAFLILQKFRKEIEDKKLNFIFANSGIEALEKIEQESDVDIVITDINMPDMDGITLLSKLKIKTPSLKTVVISAFNDIDNIRKAMNLGAFDFLTKPIDFKDMSLTIDKTYQHIQQLRENIEGRLSAEEKWHKEEIKRASLEELHRLKNEFIGFMTHELRTPLNAITANVSFLEMSMDDISFLEEEGISQMDLIQRIKQGGQVLLQLIQSNLDVEKLEAGKINLDLQCHDLVILIDKVVLSFEMLAKQKQLELNFERSSSSCMVMCDENYFLQVLRNLVGNGIQFTEKGKVVVTFEEKEDRVFISIRDTGLGIPEEDISRIFMRFEQLHRPKQEQQGAGLGLTYCQKIIELHKGEINVVSEKGVGSVFTVQIPKD